MQKWFGNRSRKGGNDNKYIVTEHEYIFVYARNNAEVSINGREHGGNKYIKEDEFIAVRGKYSTAKLDLSTLEYRKNLDYPIVCPDGSILYAGNVSKQDWEVRRNGGNSPRDWQWRWSEQRLKGEVIGEHAEIG